MFALHQAKGGKINRPILPSTKRSDLKAVGLLENDPSIHQLEACWLQNLNCSRALLASSSGVSSLASGATSAARVNQHVSRQGDAWGSISEEITNQTLVQQERGPQAVTLSSYVHFPRAAPSFDGLYTAAWCDVQLPMPVAAHIHQPGNHFGATDAVWSRMGGPLRVMWPQRVLPPRDNSILISAPQLLGNFDIVRNKSLFHDLTSFGDTLEQNAARAQSASVAQEGPPKQDQKRQRLVRDKTPAPGGRASRGEAERLDGDSRLVIDFESLGELGALPQTFGRERWILPNGLRGRHISYGQKWHFETIHNPGSVQVHGASQGPHLVCVTWRITHVKTDQVTERTETEDEAWNRLTHGWSIATKVFLDAMAKCAEGLRAQAEREKEPLKKRKLAEAAHALEAKGFSQGPLMFGLRHRSVQEFFQSGRSSSSRRVAKEAT